MTEVAVKDRLGVLKIHLPLDRALTQQLRLDCLNKIEARVARFRKHNVSATLLTDNNTHGGMPKWGGHALYEHEFDYIGAAHASNGCRLKVLKRRKLDGHVDNHEYIGVKVCVTWPSGRKTKMWLVQANIGRDASAETALNDMKRIKKAFPGHSVIGLDEIDEADDPNETMMVKKVWNPKKYHIVGLGKKSLVIVSPKLRVPREKIMQACKGMDHITPARDLVELVISPPKPLIRKDKS